MPQEIITIVSGLPRSGTSMLMKMLQEGGLEPLTDYEREPDKDNPKGYYEYEKVKDLPEETDWLEKAKGKSVKVLAELVKYLPDDYEYRVIFIQRNLDEIIQSQRKMLIRKGEDPDKVKPDELKNLFRSYLKILKTWLKKQDNVEVLYVNYNQIIEDPQENAEKINQFLGNQLDEKAMVSVIDPSLYRNRA